MGSDRLQIVVGQTHPWFEREEIDLTELTQDPLGDARAWIWNPAKI